MKRNLTAEQGKLLEIAAFLFQFPDGKDHAAWLQQLAYSKRFNDAFPPQRLPDAARSTERD